MEHEIGIWLNDLFDTEVFADCFLVEVDWNVKQKKLVVFVDCDQGLTLRRCQIISKFIAEKLDATDLIGTSYRLDVSSPGLEKPLLLKRQYHKNVGRDVRIEMKDQTTKAGKMIQVDDKNVILEITASGKKKKKSITVVPILWEEIDKTFVEIRFKK